MSKAITTISKNEIHLLLKLTIPLILTGFIESSVGFFSTIFLAHLGIDALAAGAVVTRIFFTLMVIIWGTLCSVSVLVSQNHGAKNIQGTSRSLRDGLILAWILVIPAVLLLWNIAPILLWAGQDATTAQLAKNYMRALAWGIPPDFVSLVLMQFLIGLGHARTNMIFTLLWVPLDILLNYVLMFGKWGFPAMGFVGMGWGTTASYWILTIVLLIYLLCCSKYRFYFKNILQLEPPYFLKDLLHVGIPMGTMYLVELAYFLVLTLWMGYFNSNVLAAHQIALQYLMLLGTVVFSIAQAVTVRMGHTLGAKDPYSAERACYIGILISIIFMVLAGVFYWLMPKTLIALDLDPHLKNNIDVISYATTLLAICGIFQIIEAIRTVLFGALRSLKDTRFTLLVSIVSFWGISLPVGYSFITYFHWDGAGLWWGMVIGATVSTALLWIRFQHKMKHYLKNVAIV